jgi:O-succinylbenzoic acid--CoA ligase
MEQSTKELRLIRDTPDLDVAHLMADLARALVGTGPALGFGDVHSTHVPRNIAVVIATSGSTGRPKEVGLSASALLSSASASNKNLGARLGQVWSLLLPLTHVAGVNVLVRSLELGTLPIDLRHVENYPKADFTAIVPTQLFRALNGDERLLDHLRNCKKILVGGAALSASQAETARNLGLHLVPTYGMTETSGGCVYDGYPLEGVQLRIENGEIQIKGPTLATNYLNDEEGWQSSLADGWFVTKDRGEYQSGKLQVLGRSDDVIVTGGEKISLRAVEECLASKFPSTEFAVFVVKDAEWGDALHVAIAGPSALSDQEISGHLSQELGVAGKPKKIIRLEVFPRTDIGKVDGLALQEIARTI